LLLFLKSATGSLRLQVLPLPLLSLLLLVPLPLLVLLPLLALLALLEHLPVLQLIRQVTKGWLG
jgi:hypothetical protein